MSLVAPFRPLAASPSARDAEDGLAVEDTRSTWLVHLATLVSLALMWIAFFDLVHRDRHEVLQAASVRSDNLALAVEQYALRLARNADAVTQLVAAEYLRGRRGPELQRILRERAQNNDALREVLVTDPEGQLLLTSHARSALGARALVLPEVVAASRVTPAAPLAASGPSPWLVPFVRPIHANNLLYGWAAVLIEERRFADLLARARLHEDTVVALYGPEGRVLAGWSNTDRVLPPRLPAATLELSARAQPLQAQTLLDGEPRLVSVSKMDNYPVATVVAVSASDVLREHRRRRNIYLAACLLVSALAGGFIVAVSRASRRRIRAAQRLGATRARLSVLNERLEQEVSRRTAQLQQANRDLESFSYSVAHDLRAPLASIDGFSAALEPSLADAPPDDKRRHYLRRIRAAAAHMGEITDALLALARLGHQPLQLRQVDLQAMAQAVLEALRERDPQREVQVELRALAPATGDAALLRQVLENLLGNAWKFLRHTPCARIEVGQQPDGAYYVRDNGPGFDMAYAEALFKPFQRLHGPDYPGTGIGLTTVQRIVELHGGRIWGEGEPGRGATFFFTLGAP